MSERRAFFLVGHARWGKSSTLRALTGGLHRSITIGAITLHIRRMSNDDDPVELLKFIEAVEPKGKENLLIALCPNFTDAPARTNAILTTLHDKGYRFFFFVMERQYKSEGRIAPDEIAKLRNAGFVEVYSGRGEADLRARKLRSFIVNAVSE